MCLDICTINIRVSIRVRGLHLVLWNASRLGLVLLFTCCMWPARASLLFPSQLRADSQAAASRRRNWRAAAYDIERSMAKVQRSDGLATCLRDPFIPGFIWLGKQFHHLSGSKWDFLYGILFLGPCDWTNHQNGFMTLSMRGLNASFWDQNCRLSSRWSPHMVMARCFSSSNNSQNSLVLSRPVP